MLCEVDDATAWLRTADAAASWGDWQLGLDKDALLSCGGVSAKTTELVDKVDESKLAHDVDDLSAIFEGLVDGADTALPCDDLELVDLDLEGSVATSEASAKDSSDVASGWIDSLEDDTVNVNDLSAAFDALVAEQSESATETDEDEEMEDAEVNYEDDDESSTDGAPDVKIIPAAPVWASTAPLDPRSCICTPVFKNIDSRIPQISMPRMDLSLARDGALKTAGSPGVTRPAQSMSPKCEKTKKVATYQHDPATCWICKSSKTAEKKRALHRYHEKRTRRNWKRGPRYSGRSHVATSRVRNGGRFICTTRWI